MVLCVSHWFCTRHACLFVRVTLPLSAQFWLRANVVYTYVVCRANPLALCVDNTTLATHMFAHDLCRLFMALISILLSLLHLKRHSACLCAPVAKLGGLTLLKHTIAIPIQRRTAWWNMCVLAISTHYYRFGCSVLSCPFHFFSFEHLVKKIIHAFNFCICLSLCTLVAVILITIRNTALLHQILNSHSRTSYTAEWKKLSTSIVHCFPFDKFQILADHFQWLLGRSNIPVIVWRLANANANANAPDRHTIFILSALNKHRLCKPKCIHQWHIRMVKLIIFRFNANQSICT